MPQVNNEAAIARRRRYYLAHCEELKRYARQYRLKNHDRIQSIDHRHYMDNRDRSLAYHKTHRAAIKCEVMRHYSPSLTCQRCGIADLRVLSVDHIDGGGNAHKKREGTTNIYYWLKRHGFPPGFQILCMNCQWIKKVENHEDKGCGWRRQDAIQTINANSEFSRGSKENTGHRPRTTHTDSDHTRG